MTTTATSTSDNPGAGRSNESRSGAQSSTVYSHRPMQPAVVTARPHNASHPHSHSGSHTPAQVSLSAPSPAKGGAYIARTTSPVNNASSSTSRPPRVETPPSLRLSIANIRADYMAMAEELTLVRAARDDLANRCQAQSAELDQVKRAYSALERTHYAAMEGYSGSYHNPHAGREIEIEERSDAPYTRPRESRPTTRERVPSGREVGVREGAPGRGGRGGHDEPGGYPRDIRDRDEPQDARSGYPPRDYDTRGPGGSSTSGGRGGRMDEGRDTSRYDESDYEMRAAQTYLSSGRTVPSSSAAAAHPSSPQATRDPYFGQGAQRPLYTSAPHPTSEHPQSSSHTSHSPYTHHPHASGRTTPRGPHSMSREPSSINMGMTGPASHAGPGIPGSGTYSSRRPLEEDYDDETSAERHGRASKRRKGRQERGPSPAVAHASGTSSGSGNTSHSSLGQAAASMSASTSATSIHLSPHPGRAQAQAGQHQARSRSNPSSPHVPGHEIAHLNINTIPPGFVKEGEGWHAFFDPRSGVYSPAPSSPIGSGSGPRSPASGASASRGVLRRTMDVDLSLTIQNHSVVCSVQFSNDGRWIATGCNRTTQIYDASTGAQVCVLEDPNAGTPGTELYVRCIRFSPDSMMLATGSEDRKIRVWDLNSRTMRRVMSGHEQEIYCLDFAPSEGRHVASGSADNTLRIWDLTSDDCMVITVTDKGSTVAHTRSGSPTRAGPRQHHTPDGSDAHHYEMTTSDGHTSPALGITSVAFSPDGTFVAAGSLDTAVRVWSVADGTLLRVLRGHKDSVYSICWMPSSRSIISGSLDCLAKMWDWDWDPADLKLPLAQREHGKEPPLNFSGHKDYVLCVGVSRDGRYVITGSKDRCVHVWDARTGALQFGLLGHKNSVVSLGISPLGGMFATGSGDNTARIWTYSTIA